MFKRKDTKLIVENWRQFINEGKKTRGQAQNLHSRIKEQLVRRGYILVEQTIDYMDETDYRIKKNPQRLKYFFRDANVLVKEIPYFKSIENILTNKEALAAYCDLIEKEKKEHLDNFNEKEEHEEIKNHNYSIIDFEFPTDTIVRRLELLHLYISKELKNLK